MVTRLQNLTAENAGLREQVRDLKARVETLFKQLGERDSQLKHLKDKNKSLQSENESMRSKLKRIDEIA